MEVMNSVYMAPYMNSAYKNNKKTKIWNIQFPLPNDGVDRMSPFATR